MAVSSPWARTMAAPRNPRLLMKLRWNQRRGCFCFRRTDSVFCIVTVLLLNDRLGSEPSRASGCQGVFTMPSRGPSGNLLSASAGPRGHSRSCVGARNCLQVVVSLDDRPAHRVNVTRRRLRALRAGRARQEVFFQCGKFGLLDDHPEVVAFQIVVGDMFGIPAVGGHL